MWHSHLAGSRVWLLSQKGERLKLSVARNRGKNTTLLASITLEGMGPSLAVEGSTTAEVFEAYLEHVLLPELGDGRVIIMDSLPAHKLGRVRELIEGRGCELLYLPGYSPDYNQSYRGGILEDQGDPAQSLCPDSSRGPARGVGRSIIRDQPPGCPGVLRARGLPFYGSTTMKHAVCTLLDMDFREFLFQALG